MRPWPDRPVGNFSQSCCKVGESGVKWGHVEPDGDGEVPPTPPSPGPGSHFNEGELWGLAFLGQFEYTLDAKNRLTIPPKFRGALSDGVVLAKELEPCVSIWPAQGWLHSPTSDLVAATRSDPEARDLER